MKPLRTTSRFLLFSMLATILPLARGVVYVDASASGANDGTSWANAYTSLKAAVDTSPAASEIWVATGTYKPGAARADSFTLKEGMALYGGFTSGMTSLAQRDWNANPTILSGEIQGDAFLTNNAYHIVVANTNGVLNGFVLTGGCANGADPLDKGGAVYASYAGRDNAVNWPQVFANCVFSNNAAVSGGAIYGNYSNFTITNALFTMNVATNGGAMHVNEFTNNRKIEILDTTFRQNQAIETGGAIYGSAFQKWPIRRCSFIGNRAGSSGGAISHSSNWMADGIYDCMFIDNETHGNGGALNYGNPGLKVYDSTFVLNRAPNGNAGAANPFNQTASILRSKFVGNLAKNEGGALAVNARELVLEGSLFVGNLSSNSSAGAVSVSLGWNTPPRPTMPKNLTIANNKSKNVGAGLSLAAGKSATNSNCIVWGNRSDSGLSQMVGDGIVCRYSDIEGGWAGDNNLDQDAKFAKGPAGTWTSVGAYDPATGQTVLTDAAANWAPGLYAGACLNPDGGQYLQTLIATNTATTMTVYGDVGAFTAAGDAYQVWDYHLMSSGGRWTPLGWVNDNVSSPCVDAGDPAFSYANEPPNNGGRINMGVYGNTAQASKKPMISTLLILR